MSAVTKTCAALLSVALRGTRAEDARELQECRATSLIRVAVLAFDRPDAGLIFFERVDVHHPVEDYGMESSTRGIAGFLRGDRSSSTRTADAAPAFPSLRSGGRERRSSRARAIARR